MIDALFGSKTRVKLLNLFLNNPTQPFYVREITRIIDEQINSVRRELSNMMEVGVIVCESVDNRLYYQANHDYEFFMQLHSIFTGGKVKYKASSIKNILNDKTDDVEHLILSLPGIKLAILSGSFVINSGSSVDILIAGDISAAKAKSMVTNLEKKEGRELTYCLLTYEEFFYRFSVRDRFVTDIINNKHRVLLDTDKILSKNK